MNKKLISFSAIKATTDALNDEGFECAGYVVDISDREQVYEVAKKVKVEIGKVDILINNAGVVTCRTLLDLPDKAIETTYGVNILSHYWVSFYSITACVGLIVFFKDSKSFSARHDCRKTWTHRYCELRHGSTWNVRLH